MRNLPVGLIRCKIQLIFADNAVVPTAGCGTSRRRQKYPAIRPMNSQAGRLRYGAFGSVLWGPGGCGEVMIQSFTVR
jgi:hypothetical protein